MQLNIRRKEYSSTNPFPVSKVGSKPCRSVSQGVGLASCLPKTAWPPTLVTLDGGRLGIASQALGIARASIEDAIKYSKERVQFDQPISSFQAIQWMIADMWVEYQAAWLLTWRASKMKDMGITYSKEAAAAKLKASEVAMFCANKAIQLHGGYGYTEDFNVERYYRDAKITELYEGTSEIQRMVIARSLLG